MKDAQGHGSDARGMASRETAGHHQAGVLRLGRRGFKVQGLDTNLAGTPWGTFKTVGNRTVAEKIAQGARVDRRAELVRVR